MSLALYYQLHGDVLAMEKKFEEADQFYLQGIEEAKKQGAMLSELLVTYSRSKMLHQQGDTATAYEILSTAWDRFGSGWNTPRLREVGQFLRDLRKRAPTTTVEGTKQPL